MQTTRKKLSLLTFVLLFAIACPVFAGKIIYVDDDGPADFNNIQAAIDDSNDGDTIIVAEGTYENVSIDGKSITLRSTDPTNPETVAATIIDGGGREPAVYFSGAGDYPSWTLSGFTITNGGGGDGGGVHCYASKPTIINNVITNNTADTDGGGILCSRCPSGMIANNIISRNLADDGTAGGILLYYNSSLTVANCTITDNVGFYGNGGIVLMYSSSAVITNSIVWGNNSEQVACYLDSNAEVSYSDIEGGYEGIGNIDADPCFVDPEGGDYHLRSERGRYWPDHDVWVLDKVTSPCIDAGDPYDDPSAEPMPNGDLVNMGAYGATAYASMSEWALRGDLNYDGIVNMIDFTIFGDYWLQPSLRAREIDSRLVCANNLRALGRALYIYANDYDDESPTPGQWCDLLLQYDDVTEEMFVCPSAEPGRSHYAINPNSMGSISPPDMVWLFETGPGWNQFGGPELLAPENHQGKGIHILFHDGHVEFVRGGRVDELRWERK